MPEPSPVEKFVDQNWGHYTTGNLTQRTLMGAAQGYREGLIKVIKLLQGIRDELSELHSDLDRASVGRASLNTPMACTEALMDKLSDFLKGQDNEKEGPYRCSGTDYHLPACGGTCGEFDA